jgi:RNA polymerase sigma factor (sigma-70 family)
MPSDRQKLEELYRLYEKPFYHIAYAILHHHQQAEDAVSEAFLQVMKHLDKINQPDSPAVKNYMIQIIKHTAINQYRKNQRQNQYCTEFDDSVFQIPDSENELENRFQKLSLRQMLSELFSVVSENITLQKKSLILNNRTNSQNTKLLHLKSNAGVSLLYGGKIILITVFSAELNHKYSQYYHHSYQHSGQLLHHQKNILYEAISEAELNLPMLLDYQSLHRPLKL